MMKTIFSKPQVFFCSCGMLAGLLTGCASLSSSGDPVHATDLQLQPVQQLNLSVSESADALAYFSLGLNRELSGDFPGAIEAYQQAIQHDPGNDALYMTASRRLIAAGRMGDAFALLEELVAKKPDNVTARRWLAKLYLQEGKNAEARAVLQQAVSYHPASERIYLEAVQLALSEKDLEDVLHLTRLANQHADHPLKTTEILIKLLAGKVKQADDAASMLAFQEEKNEVLEQAITDFPESDVFHLLKASFATEKNQWQEAFAAYTALDVQFGGTEEIRGRILSHALKNTGGGTRGVRQLEKKFSESPETALRYYLQGLLKDVTRQPEAALAAYETAVSLDEHDVESLRKLAVHTYLNGQSLRASELLNKVLQTHADDAEMLLLAGQLALGSENFEQAKSYLERCLLRVRQGEEVEDLPLVHTQLAMALIASGEQPQRAVDAMVEAADESGNLEWIWQFAVRRIMIMEETDQTEAVRMEKSLILLLEDLSDRLPNNPEVEYLLGRSHALQKQYSQAVDAYLRSRDLADQMSNPGAWVTERFQFDLAAAYERAGLIEKSVALFEKIISENPNHHPSLNYVAYMWAERNQNLEKAMTYTRRALSLDPENGSYLDTLGWIQYQQGDFKAAYRSLMKAAELIPEESVVAEHLGDVLMKLDRPWEAMGYYRIAVLLGAAEREDIVARSLHLAEIAVSDSLRNQP